VSYQSSRSIFLDIDVLAIDLGRQFASAEDQRAMTHLCHLVKIRGNQKIDNQEGCRTVLKKEKSS